MATKQDFVSYEEASKAVIAANIESSTVYKKWYKTAGISLPREPNNVYKSEWDEKNGWDVFFGKEPKKPIVSYNDARDAVMRANINSSSEYKAWYKSAEVSLPGAPDVRYADEWELNGNWYGFTGNIQTFVSYEEASAAAIAAGITGQIHYNRWYKTAGISLPSHPQREYKDVWEANGGWYGFRTGLPKKEIVSYEEASAAAIAANIENIDQYNSWYKSANVSLPGAPDKVYADVWEQNGKWRGFLGKEEKEPVVTYYEARVVVIEAGLTSQAEYYKWYKTAGISLPSNPPVVYKDVWEANGGWYGFRTGLPKKEIVSYEEASKATIAAGITSSNQYSKWYKTAGISLPSDPDKDYEDDWRKNDGWYGFLEKRMTKPTLLFHLRALRPILHTLTEVELRTILIQQNAYDAFEKFHTGKTTYKEAIITLLDNESDDQDSEENENSSETTTETQDATKHDDVVANHATSTAELVEENRKQETASTSLSDSAKTFDWFDENQSICSCDEETLEFFYNNKIQSSWNDILNQSQEYVETEITNLRNKTGGDYFTTFKERFLAQYEGATNIQLPEGYGFNKGNGIIQPLLMQKLIAYMVKTKKRVGNWSGTGAGKTLGAILASRVTNSKLTVIVTINNTIIDKDSGWEKEINTAFPNYCNVMAKTKNVKLDPIKPNYLLLNYEAFSNGDELVNHLLELPIDMIVLDEIHFAKSTDKNESLRRQQLTRLVSTATNQNPDCKVLGMSATPVINELTEAVSLLQLITGNKYDELKTKHTVNNAIALHKHIVLNGIRWMPKYDMVLNPVIIPVIPSDEQLMQLESINKSAPLLELERILIDLKMQTILDNITTGTVVYTHYTDEGNIAEQLKTAIQNKGFTCAVYTGKEPTCVKKENLEKFKNRQIDVLIGSSTIGTGVDGLQLVSNKMIIATLPWTNAAYQQLIGRIHRQGSVFNKVDVIVPQVKRLSDNWSWDKNRMDRIEYKKTLADTAVDGVLPKGSLMSEKQLLTEALNALHNWTARVANDEIALVERTQPTITYTESKEEREARVESEYEGISKAIFNNRLSSTTHTNLLKDNEPLHEYHRVYREMRKSWSEVPYEFLIEKIFNNDNSINSIADFGCGEALLSENLPSKKVFSIDHVNVSANTDVIECDMVKTPLEDNQVDAAVFSLSLMGSNWADYLLEAFRVTKPGGQLFVAETINKHQGDDFVKLKDAISDAGFKIDDQSFGNTSKFVYFHAHKPKRYF